MSQATTAIADGTGAQVLAELTSAFSAAQSWQFGSTDPYTAGYNVNAGTWWMDQGNMLVKQRNITNDAWVTKGKINADGTISLYDDLGRIISQTYATNEFLENQLAITYVSPTSFTVAGNLTGIFTANRKVKIYLKSSTAISYVVSSVYSTVTTVTLGNSVLDSTVTAVKYSIVQNGEPQNTVHTADLSPYAPLASPAFTGTPTAPTATKGDSSTKLATTAFVTAAIGLTTHADLDATSTLGGYTAAKLIGEFSHDTNGYHKLPGGTIIQWGYAAAQGSYSFPIAFPNACLSVSLTPFTPTPSSSGDNGCVILKSKSASGFTYSSNDDGNNFPVNYIAIGY